MKHFKLGIWTHHLLSQYHTVSSASDTEWTPVRDSTESAQVGCVSYKEKGQNIVTSRHNVTFQERK